MNDQAVTLKEGGEMFIGRVWWEAKEAEMLWLYYNFKNKNKKECFVPYFNQISRQFIEREMVQYKGTLEKASFGYKEWC